MLHGLPTIAGQGFIFDGMHHQSYMTTYSRLDDCPSHEPIGSVEVLPWSVSTTTVEKILERVRADLGPTAVVDLNQDLLASLTCAACNETTPHFASLGKVSEEIGRCPKCGEHRAPTMYHTLDETTTADKTLGELGVPRWDIVIGRCGMQLRCYEFAGDRAEVLGTMLAESEDVR